MAQESELRRVKLIRETYLNLPPTMKHTHLVPLAALLIAVPAFAQQSAMPDPQMKAELDQLTSLGCKPIESLSPEEVAALRDQLQSAEGPAMLRRATDQYNAQDVHYRGATAPVISELLRTLHTVQQKR